MNAIKKVHSLINVKLPKGVAFKFLLEYNTKLGTNPLIATHHV